LLIALVQKKVWIYKQELAYVLQSSNPQQKANLLTELVNHLPPNLKELALSKALTAGKRNFSGIKPYFIRSFDNKIIGCRGLSLSKVLLISEAKYPLLTLALNLLKLGTRRN
jgi:hypothetical protein